MYLASFMVEIRYLLPLRTALERGVPIVSMKEWAKWTAKKIVAAQGHDLGSRSLQGWLSLML
jgi:carbamoyl-phosphate synthase large subunit